VINDDDDDDGNRQASKWQTLMKYHTTVLKSLEDDKEYLFGEEMVELYGNSFEQQV
jgi:predicted component of type VI protein secretion system